MLRLAVVEAALGESPNCRLVLEAVVEVSVRCWWAVKVEDEVRC